MGVRKVLVCNPLCPPHSHVYLLPGETEVGGTLSPTCPQDAILELKGGRAGRVVKCQVANPS